MLRSDMLGLNVLEEFMNVQMLLVVGRVVTYAQYHDVELAQVLRVLSLVKE